MEVLNNRATKLEALDNLIDERNIKAKEAEQELIIFIKNRPTFKNDYKFDTNDIVGSINYITTLNINNNTYPKLSKWKQLNTQVKDIIDKLPNNTKTNYKKIKIIAKGKNYGFDLVSIKNQLPQRSFFNNFSKIWGGRRKTQRKTKNHKLKGSRKIHRK